MSVFRDPNKGACPLLRAAPEGSDVLAKPLKIQQKGLDKHEKHLHKQASKQASKQQTDRISLSFCAVLNMTNRRGLPGITTGGTRLFVCLVSAAACAA